LMCESAGFLKMLTGQLAGAAAHLRPL